MYDFLIDIISRPEGCPMIVAPQYNDLFQKEKSKEHARIKELKEKAKSQQREKETKRSAEFEEKKKAQKRAEQKLLDQVRNQETKVQSSGPRIEKV